MVTVSLLFKWLLYHFDKLKIEKVPRNTYSELRPTGESIFVGVFTSNDSDLIRSPNGVRVFHRFILS